MKLSKAEIKVLQHKWFRINAPTGILLGYPKCCINAFCAQPPELLQQSIPSAQDKLRYEAACIDGKFTGFIPCYKCAQLVISGKIKLSQLIRNRAEYMAQFPNA